MLVTKLKVLSCNFVRSLPGLLMQVVWGECSTGKGRCREIKAMNQFDANHAMLALQEVSME